MNLFFNIFYTKLIYLFIFLILFDNLMLSNNSCFCNLNNINYKPVDCKRVSKNGIKTIFLPRNQGDNFVRTFSGYHYIIPGCDFRPYEDISIAVEYQESFDGTKIAQYLFGSNCLKFSGSEVVDRKKDELLADNFGLPSNFKGQICFHPKIKNWIIDFNLRVGLDEILYGSYIFLRAPLVRSIWNLYDQCYESSNIENDIIPTFKANYMSKASAIAASSISEALAGCVNEVYSPIKKLDNKNSDKDLLLNRLNLYNVKFNSQPFTFGDMKTPLEFGRFPRGALKKTALADLAIMIGYNIILDKSYHFGPFIQIQAPTGTKVNSKYLFEPIIGNGRLWELGPGISAHYNLYEQGCDILEFHLEAVSTYQFKNYQIRSLDLADNGPFSRYLLLKEFDYKLNYNKQLINCIDFATRCCYVGGSVKTEALFKFSYFHGKWALETGYDLWAKSKEELLIMSGLYPSDVNRKRLGIKGDSGCYYNLVDNNGNIVQTVVLNATESKSTIYNAANIDNPVNIEIDNASAIAYNGEPAINSNPPVLLERNKLYIPSAVVPYQLTHKFFLGFHYISLEQYGEPQIFAGAEVEFDGRKNSFNSLNQWGVWVKGMLSY